MDRAGPAGRRTGYFTKRTAEDWLGSVLDQARRGTLPGMVPTGATFADAAAEWLRYIEHDRGRKPSTVAGSQSIVGSALLPRFGTMALEAVTPGEIKSWQASMTQAASTRTKALVLMHGVSERARRVWSLSSNPVADVENPPVARGGDLQVFAPEEVWALVRAAASDADGALFLTTAFTGLRIGEQRRDWVGDDDLVFAGAAGDHLDGSALRRRYKDALAPDADQSVAGILRKR